MDTGEQKIKFAVVGCGPIGKPTTRKKQYAEKVIYKSLYVHRHVFTVMENRYSPPSLCTALEGLKVVDIIERIYLSGK